MLTRREFLSTSVVAALPVGLRRTARRSQGVIAINAARLRSRLEHLSTFGRPAGGGFEAGVSRVAYSDADRAARTWLLSEIRAAGLTPRTDAAGNVFARL